MTTATHARASTRTRWGRRILIGLGVLLVLDGAWLFFAVGSAGVFASDTGVAMEEVRRAYPTVVETMNGRGTTIGLLVAGLGVVAIVAASGRSRPRPDAAWNVLVTVSVVLGSVGAFILARGNLEVGVVYVAFAAIGALGCALARAPVARG